MDSDNHILVTPEVLYQYKKEYDEREVDIHYLGHYFLFIELVDKYGLCPFLDPGHSVERRKEWLTWTGATTDFEACKNRYIHLHPLNTLLGQLESEKINLQKLLQEHVPGWTEIVEGYQAYKTPVSKNGTLVGNWKQCQARYLNPLLQQGWNIGSYYKLMTDTDLPRQKGIDLKKNNGLSQEQHFKLVEQQANAVHSLIKDVEKERHIIKKKVHASHLSLYQIGTKNQWKRRQAKYIGTTWAKLPNSAQQNRITEHIMYCANILDTSLSWMKHELKDCPYKSSWSAAEGLLVWLPDKLRDFHTLRDVTMQDDFAVSLPEPVTNVATVKKRVVKKRQSSSNSLSDEDSTGSKNTETATLYTNTLLVAAQHFDEPIESIIEHILFLCKGTYIQYNANEALCRYLRKSLLSLNESVHRHFEQS